MVKKNYLLIFTMSVNTTDKPKNKNDADCHCDDTDIKRIKITPFIIIYYVIALITFFTYLYCGTKSQSFGQVLAGVLLSNLWPILWIYVLIRKLTDKNYVFCGGVTLGESIVKVTNTVDTAPGPSARRSLTRRSATRK